MADKYDVIVIGAGPGGMTAALYASRANLKVAMLDRGVYGGNMNNLRPRSKITRGLKRSWGPDLSEEMYQSATNFGAEFVYGNVEKIEVLDEKTKLVKTNGGELEAPVVIIATGSESRKVRCTWRRTIQWPRCIILYFVCDGAFIKIVMLL